MIPETIRQPHPDLLEPTRWWGGEELDAIAARLTDSEFLILRAITNGETNIQIASRLGIAEKSAEKHLTRLFAKLGVDQRVKAAVFYTLRDARRQQQSPASASPPGSASGSRP